MTSSHPIPALCQWFYRLAGPLDSRSAPRLALLFLGAVLARDRRTVTTWIRAAGLSDRFQSCYLAVAAAGKKADRIASRVLTEVVRPLVSGASVSRSAPPASGATTSARRCRAIPMPDLLQSLTLEQGYGLVLLLALRFGGASRLKDRRRSEQTSRRT